MSNLQQRNATIILHDQTDYATWLTQIQARCVAYNIWENIRRVTPVPFLLEPIQIRLPAFENYAPVAGIEEATRLSELSNAGQKAFKEDMEHYKMLTKQYKIDRYWYKTQQKSIQHVIALIQLTVTPYLQRTCCLLD